MLHCQRDEQCRAPATCNLENNSCELPPLENTDADGGGSLRFPDLGAGTLRDLPAPSGDSLSGAQKSCSDHNQCPSKLCDLHTLYGQQNRCARSSNVCYVALSQRCPGSGSRADPFCTIQACLDLKRPYVAVASGTYQENLVIRAAVALIATGTKQPLLRPTLDASRLKVTLLRKDPSQPALLNVAADMLLFGFKIDGGAVASEHSLVAIVTDGHSSQLESVLIQNNILGNCLAAVSASSWQELQLRDVATMGCRYGVLGGSTDVEAHGFQSLQNTDTGLALVGPGKLQVREGRIGQQQQGVALLAADAELDRLELQHNSEVGLWVGAGASATLQNVLVAHNGVGLEASQQSLLRLVNVTVAENSINQLRCDAPTLVHNSIIRHQGAAGTAFSGTLCAFFNSNVEGAAGSGANVIDQPPLFQPNSFQLAVNSPCVDAGTDNVPGTILSSFDLAGNPRKVKKWLSKNALIDMGAFELQ